MRRVLAAIAALALAGCASELVVFTAPSGDSLVLSDGTAVRYAGVRAPLPGEPFCEESREANRTLVERRKVTLVGGHEDPEREGGQVAFVYAPVRQGERDRFLFVQGELVLFGFAKVDEEGSSAGRADLLEDLRKLEAVARSLGRGIWAQEPGAKNEK